MVTIVILCFILVFSFVCHKKIYTFTGQLYEKDGSRTAELTVKFPRYCEWFGHNESASHILIDGVETYRMQGIGMTGDGKVISTSFQSYNEKLNAYESGMIYFNEDYTETYMKIGSVTFIAASDEFIERLGQ